VWRDIFPDVKFSVHGTCSTYVDFPEAECSQCQGKNVMDMSCTNGFTCGNMVSPPKDVARFMWHLFEGHLLQPSSLQEMLSSQLLGPKGAPEYPSCSSFASGYGYGLGLQIPAGGTPFPGHEGETYGFIALTAYDRERRAVYTSGIASMDRSNTPVWNDWHSQDLILDSVLV